VAIQLIVSTLFRLAAADPLPGERARDLNQNIETIPVKRVASKWATRAGQAEENGSELVRCVDHDDVPLVEFMARPAGDGTCSVLASSPVNVTGPNCPSPGPAES
jgi:hypothetical protein